MSEMPKDCIYQCPLSEEEIAEALKPFKKRDKKTVLESLDLITCKMTTEMNLLTMITCWGDNPDYEERKILSAKHLPEMIAEIRKIIWATVRFQGLNQNKLLKQSKEIREKISQLSRYLANPALFSPAFYQPCGRRQS